MTPPEPEQSLSAVELFNRSLESFREGNIAEAVACLRAGFYENLYIAPAILGEDLNPQRIWYRTADSEPRAALEYVHRYGHMWKEDGEALHFLADVWKDPLVRRERRNFVNVSKAIAQAGDASQRVELQRDHARFSDWRRISRTQSEILQRLRSSDNQRPLEQPRLELVVLASHDPAASVEFFRRLFGIDPMRTSRQARGYAEFKLPGVCLAVHGHDRLAEGDPYRLGPPPLSLGWGVVFVIRVRQLDRYYENAVRAGLDVIDRDLDSAGRRFFLVKDPSGYLIEVAEDGPEGSVGWTS